MAIKLNLKQRLQWNQYENIKTVRHNFVGHGAVCDGLSSVVRMRE